MNGFTPAIENHQVAEGYDATVTINAEFIVYSITIGAESVGSKKGNTAVYQYGNFGGGRTTGRIGDQ
jgi:hypothetical protein